MVAIIVQTDSRCHDEFLGFARYGQPNHLDGRQNRPAHVSRGDVVHTVMVGQAEREESRDIHR